MYPTTHKKGDDVIFYGLDNADSAAEIVVHLESYAAP